MPSGTNVTNLIPTITLSGGATIVPATGAAENFTSSKTYIVTAQDTIITRQYTVTVVVGNCASSNGASVCISTNTTNNLGEISSFQLSPDGTTWSSTLTATAGNLVYLRANLSGVANQAITFQDTTNPASIINIGTATTNSSGIATITYHFFSCSIRSPYIICIYAGGSVPPSNITATLNITSAGNCAMSNGASVCISTSSTTEPKRNKFVSVKPGWSHLVFNFKLRQLGAVRIKVNLSGVANQLITFPRYNKSVFDSKYRNGNNQFFWHSNYFISFFPCRIRSSYIICIYVVKNPFRHQRNSYVKYYKRRKLCC